MNRKRRWRTGGDSPLAACRCKVCRSPGRSRPSPPRCPRGWLRKTQTPSRPAGGGRARRRRVGLTDVPQALLVELQPVVLLQADAVDAQTQAVRDGVRAGREEQAWGGAAVCARTRTVTTAHARTLTHGSHNTSGSTGWMQIWTFIAKNCFFYL